MEGVPGTSPAIQEAFRAWFSGFSPDYDVEKVFVLSLGDLSDVQSIPVHPDGDDQELREPPVGDSLLQIGLSPFAGRKLAASNF